ncbi:MAG TPA: hypothetical protein VF618_21890 [Thermoanaerobaculia bacterium]
MPKLLFYVGTAFCLFLALTSGAEAFRELETSALAFVGLPLSAASPWAIFVALLAGLAIAAIFLRMSALLAARNLFGAFFGIVAVTGGLISLAFALLVQWRIVRGDVAASPLLGELHLASVLAFGFFLSMSLLALRPYFSIQASRFLSALVFLPLPLFALILLQELFLATSAAPLPAATPASRVYFAVLSILFFAIAVHCIRHRHLFLEMTNLRELMDGRVDPLGRASRRPIGGVAFDS